MSSDEYEGGDESSEEDQPERERLSDVQMAFHLLADDFQPDDAVSLNGLMLERTAKNRIWAVYHDGELCDIVNLWKFKSAIDLGQYLNRVQRQVEQSDSDGEAPWLQ